MSFHEKKSIMGFVSTFAVFAIYALVVLGMYRAGRFDPENIVRFWSALILIMIPVQIAGKIISYILFYIVYRITDDEEGPTFSDERDKIIELKADRHSHWVFSAGFMATLISIVAGAAPTTSIVILVVSMMISGMTDDVSQLVMYRRGV